MTETTDLRTERIRLAGASENEAVELLAYAENRFLVEGNMPQFPLADEAFVGQWRDYSALTSEAGSIEPLRLKLPQLAFPVEAGVSKTSEYEAATRKGMIPPAPVRGGAALCRADACRLSVYDSYAGGIGVFFAEERADFETLIQVFTCRNEPIAVSASMGATIVSGYNNWDRIHSLKNQFLSSGGTLESWPGYFQSVKADRALYQDRFVILSNGRYSAVDGHWFGLSAIDWIECSRTIRLQHECAHYFTRRLFGSMRNNLLDEIMADYAGIRSAFGYFRAEILLRFLGLEYYPNYREGGRLQNYRGDPPLSAGAFEVLSTLVWKAAWNIERFDRGLGTNCSLPAALVGIASMTLDSLGGEDAVKVLTEKYTASRSRSENRSLELESGAWKG
jgi:hypothetical protein